MDLSTVEVGLDGLEDNATTPGTMEGHGDLDNNNVEMKLATMAEVVVASTLVFSAFLLLVIMLCRRSVRSECAFKLCKEESDETLEWMEKKQDYDTFKEKSGSKNSQSHQHLSATMPKVLSLVKLVPRSKSSRTIMRNDSDAGNTLTISSPGGSGSRSPGITRSLKHGSIPFTLPPTMMGRSSSMDANLVERVQPKHPRSYSENDMPPPSMGDIPEDFDESTNNNSSDDIPGQEHSPQPPNVSKTGEFKLRSTGNFRNSLLGQIQPELYKYSEHEEHDLPPSQFGRIWFTLVYDAAIEALTVKVIKVRQLPGRGSNVPHDCFVKVFLLPDERMSQQTKVKRRTNNPRFNESFVFQASATDIKERTLRLSVYDVDKRTVARHLLGHALVTLSDVDLLSQSEDVMWRDLDERAHPGDSGTSLGEINISLAYLPTLNRLTVVVLRARNLREIDLEETGVCVKVTLTHGHQVIKTRKTAIKRGDCDPHYNESFSFTVTSKDIESSCLSINVITIGQRSGFRHLTSSLKSLVSTGKPRSEHKYGRVVVGSFMFCRGEQLLHWQEMLAQPRKTIAKWHPLSEVATQD